LNVQRSEPGYPVGCDLPVCWYRAPAQATFGVFDTLRLELGSITAIEIGGSVPTHPAAIMGAGSLHITVRPHLSAAQQRQSE